jgi:catechol 2,3-dioxygenase-like lactoylglutathione lyase family enzyme
VETPFLHHILIAVDDVERSRRFYRDVLEFQEVDRPTFPFPGVWLQIGVSCQIHIAMRSECVMRRGKGNDPYDVHFALRVRSYRKTLDWLRTKGFREDVPDDDLRNLHLRPDSITGHPQLYILDPDRNIIEFNCETLE